MLSSSEHLEVDSEAWPTGLSSSMVPLARKPWPLEHSKPGTSQLPLPGFRTLWNNLRSGKSSESWWPGFSSTCCESPMIRLMPASAFCSKHLFLPSVHRRVVLLLASYDSGAPFKGAFCWEAAIRVVNSLCHPCAGASSISYASQYSVLTVGDI